MTRPDRSTLAAQVAAIHEAQRIFLAERLVHEAVANLPERGNGLGGALRAYLEPLLDDRFPGLLASLLGGGRAIYSEHLNDSITPERDAGAA